ncbi:DUF1310 family protein [Streptococcus suis]|uniref:DUF1310 family protein n=1 Tax=Streptococcus suis TaxID=1307 RepID=UPI0014782632
MKTWQKWLAGTLASITILIGLGVMYHMNKEQELREEMIKIVESDEAKKLFEEELKYLDPKALTEDGLIKTYEVDYDSLEKNPMNGFSVHLIINADKDTYLRVHLGRYSTDGGFEISGVDESDRFSELIN